jgi:HSP20 family protein
MNMKKPSFLSRFTSSTDDYDDFSDEVGAEHANFEGKGPERHAHFVAGKDDTWMQKAGGASGELAMDVYQTQDAIVIKAFIAGVQPNSVDISLTREMLTVSGQRQDEREVEEDGYFQRELFWGSFSRTILLPEEVDVDLAEATEKHGILMIRLPKVNKSRQTKLKVRAR